MSRIEDQLEHAKHVIAEIERHLPDWRQHTGYSLPTGYATNTRPNGHVTGSSDSDRLAGSLAAAIDYGREKATHSTAAVTTGLRDAVHNLTGVLAAMQRPLPRIHDPELHGPEEKPRGEPGCRSCAKVKNSDDKPTWMPVSRAGLCDWCYRYRLAEGTDPPVTIVEAHHRGERITTRHLARIKRKHR